MQTKRKISIHDFIVKKHKKSIAKLRKRKLSILLQIPNKKPKVSATTFDDLLFIAKANITSLSSDGRFLSNGMKLGMFINQLFKKNKIYKTTYLAKQRICLWLKSNISRNHIIIKNDLS